MIEITNADPRRGVGHEKVLTRIKIDDAAIALVAEQGYAMTDVPPVGELVKAHPDRKHVDRRHLGSIGPSRPTRRTWRSPRRRPGSWGSTSPASTSSRPTSPSPSGKPGGGICEVNAAPGFRMHTHPTVGDPQYIAKPVIDMLFPPGTPSRIPIIAVTGTNGKTTTSRMIAHIFKGIGRKVGMTSTDGVVIDERADDQVGRVPGRSRRGWCYTEPPRRHGGLRGGPRGHPARGSGLPAQRRRRLAAQRAARPPGPARDRHPRAAGRREGRGRGSRTP